MDINHLLAREQILLIKTPGAGARHARAGLAAGYARRLASSAYPHRRVSVAERADG